MEHLTASTSAIPFSGEDWFDPLEDAVRFQVRAFIEALVEEEAQAALGGRERYQRNGPPKGYRNGHRHRQLVGTFGALTALARTPSVTVWRVPPGCLGRTML